MSAWCFCRVAAQESKRPRSDESFLPGHGRNRRTCARLSLGTAIPGDQKDLELFLCARRRRLLLPDPGAVLSDYRNLAAAKVVHALCLDRHERDHQLSQLQTLPPRTP